MTYSIEHYEKVLLPRIFEDVKALASSKGAEYAHGDDRLDNFRRNGKDCGVEMETCWRIYAGKHWDSVTTYVKDIQQGKTREYSESITGRAMDLIVYLTLFIAMVEERQKTVEPRTGSTGDHIMTTTTDEHGCYIGLTRDEALATRDVRVGKPEQMEK